MRDQIIREAGGNPLALLELPQGLTPAQLAGGFGLPGAVSLPERIEESFLRQLDTLPAGTRRLVQLAAADPSGDPSLVWRAAGRPGGVPSSPMRSAAYRSMSSQDRRDMHRALAKVTDARLDPDRRAWHRAQAAPEPDDDVAAELERSAGRAQARGGLAAAAAFLERSVALTVDQVRRTELPGARLITVQGYGHTELGNPRTCAQDYIADYLINGVLPKASATCQQDATPFP